MAHLFVLVLHIVTGTAGLLLGPIVMYQQTRQLAAGRTGSGRAAGLYRIAVLGVSVSAVVLVVGYRRELWWLIPVSVMTYALAELARRSARRGYRGWTHGYAHGMGGSYIALVTAFIVVALTVDGPVTGIAQLVPWLAPTVVGTVAIEVWRRRLDALVAPVARAAEGSPTPAG